MEKINIAELLKDCPVGMELDCTMYEDVYFDYVDELNIIHCYIQREGYKTSITFNQYGTPNSDVKSKCVIFPKGKTTWEGFQRPFENGDIISNDKYIAIFYKIGTPCHCKSPNVVYYHCYYSPKYSNFKGKLDFGIGCSTDFKYATEEEKEKLFDAIKANGYKWNAETKTLEKLPKFKVGDRIIHKQSGVYCNIGEYVESFKGYNTNIGLVIRYDAIDDWELYPLPNKFDISTLIPFESRVLMRSSNAREWVATFYSHYNNNKFYGCGVCCDQCIPYEGNEQLLGTTNDCAEYYKTWK